MNRRPTLLCCTALRLAWVAAAFVPGAHLLAADAVRSPTQEPEGIALNAATGSYSVHRVPKRSLDAVMKSFAGWQHQVLADDSTADYSAEDGILSMECSACGLSRPSAIDVATIDLDTIVAYEAGAWHLGMRSKDGSQDFFGVLRGELGPEAHDSPRSDSDRRVALTALADLYDLAFLTQHSPAGSTATKAGKNASAAAKPIATSLATLAAGGDVEGIQAQARLKGGSQDIAHALELAYGARARDQMLQGEIDGALETLGKGRQKFGKSPALREREAHFVVVGDAYDRLRLAVKLDMADLQRYLQQIRMLEPQDATSIEQMLARVLSNRIADQRAAGRTAVADDLMISGRKLFPAWADELTHGSRGALPEGGVEIGTAETSGREAGK